MYVLRLNFSASNAVFQSRTYPAKRNGIFAARSVTISGGRRIASEKEPRIKKHAHIAGRRFLLSLKRSRNTVPVRVITLRERQAAKMNEDLFRALLYYKSVMAQAKRLLERGIITQRDYAHFDTMFLEKYHLCLDSIFKNIG